MTYEDKTPLYLKKSELLKNAPIRLDTATCIHSDGTDVCVSRLYTNEIIEIDMIVSGSGIHRVLNQSIPCKAGDIYIVAANVPKPARPKYSWKF